LPGCAKAPDFQQDSNPSKLWKSRGASVKLNCTALLFWDPSEEPCETTPQWSKDGKPLNNQTLYLQNTTSWFAFRLVVSSLLEFALREPEQFGLYSCTVRNISSDFSLQNSSKLGNSVNSPKAAVCISRQGLLHLLELCQQPILITLEGQIKRMSPEIKRELSENQHRLTLLTWRQNSVTPSSSFWKELALAMPRSVIFHKESAGDPQTVLQDDKDPMLTLDPDYLDCRSDIDPAGDLGKSSTTVQNGKENPFIVPKWGKLLCSGSKRSPSPCEQSAGLSSTKSFRHRRLRFGIPQLRSALGLLLPGHRGHLILSFL
uniref:Single Ig IL-1-related receptor-like n=1 Tax=Cyprinodon variegatus TaxID=28743 RepID=A0A3Q2DTX0_CYPVA